MSVFRELERRIDDKLRKLFVNEGGAGQRRELIEIQRAVLEEISSRAQLLPRARQLFPFNYVRITIPVPEPDRRTAFQVVFLEGDALENEIKAHLRREQIEFPADLDVEVDLVEEEMPDFAEKGFHIVFEVKKAPAPAVDAAPTMAAPAPVRKAEIPKTVFTVLEGIADNEQVTLSKARIHVGRMADVLDDNRRLVRRNDIFFKDSKEAPNSTVSRAHAHIEYDASSASFRLFDDGSAYGTSVLQSGRLVNIPKSGGRGIKLNSSDEIYFGQARVRFEIAE